MLSWASANAIVLPPRPSNRSFARAPARSVLLPGQNNWPCGCGARDMLEGLCCNPIALQAGKPQRRHSSQSESENFNSCSAASLPVPAADVVSFCSIASAAEICGCTISQLAVVFHTLLCRAQRAPIVALRPSPLTAAAVRS